MTDTALVVFGTRPEAIKLAPLVAELKRRDGINVSVCVTGQHREMLDQVLDAFDLSPDFDLNLMRPNQSLSDVTSGVLKGVEGVIDEVRPSVVVVQGDTTTAMAGALAAYYAQVPVAHVEAGLRTGQKYSPFPEEVNRSLISVMADLHFAPTERARQNLLHSGVPEHAIAVTGNTAIDALQMMAGRASNFDLSSEELNGIPDALTGLLKNANGGKRLVLVTGHRRESFGADLESICRALLEITERHEDVELAYPVHLNPRVREPVFRLLGEAERIWLFEPPAYPGFVWLLSHAHIVITDSGGIQEEAPSLDKPVLVTRRVTERQEAVDSGCARLVGTETSTIMEAADELLTDPNLYRSMADAPNPFGDGTASAQITDRILEWLSSRE